MTLADDLLKEAYDLAQRGGKTRSLRLFEHGRMKGASKNWSEP
jgi:hypothetical protein